MAFTEIGSDGPVARSSAVSAVGSARWRRPTVTFVGLLLLIWLILYGLHALLPEIQSGAMAIYAAKSGRFVKQQMFGPSDRVRIMIFGDSRVITGFYPGEFDNSFGEGVRSYNMGLPAERRFLPQLEAALAQGNVPTHVLLTYPWGDEAEPAPRFALLRDDNKLINALLPFRAFPRDVVLFAYNYRFRFAEGIRYTGAQIDQMIVDRGWYFIRWQSHFANDALPDDFAIPSDRSRQIDAREVPARSLVRDRLMQLASQYGFKVLLVPGYHRDREFAAAPATDADRDTVVLNSSPLVRVIGPDYFTYPTRFFADPVHLNPRGRSIYTAELAALLKKHQAF